MSIADIRAYLRSREWVEQHGGSVFRTHGAFEWFVRQHRDELLASGELIVRKGAGGTLIGPRFGEVVAEILRRESSQQCDLSAGCGE